MSPDRQTIALYDAQAAAYAACAPAERPRLAAFLADLPAGGHVLDLGCGPGHAAAQMVKAGFEVTALDASAEMAAYARRTYGLEVMVADFHHVTGDAVYDGVWANFSLLHAPRDEMPGHLAALVRALKPGGSLHIGLKTGTGEARDGLGRLYTYYTEDEIAGLLEAAGLAVLSRDTGADPGFDGVLAPWIVLRARRQ